MNRTKPLRQWLRDVGDELEAAQPPRAVWRRIAEAVDHGSTPAPRWRGALAWSGAAACALVLLGSVLLMLQAPETGSTQAHGNGFVPLRPTDHWGDEPTWLVDAEMPAERLAALGLPYDPARAGELVRAELLLHASGEVLAVRFVR